jgi:THAP4-like, heme-binding beta-barrel domain
VVSGTSGTICSQDRLFLMSKLPSELPPEIVRISWLLGHWEGVGQGQYPNSSNFSFIQQLEFNNDGRPFIDYESKSWELNADGTAGNPLHSEKGFWKPGEGTSVEVSISHVTGISEIWTGLNEVLTIEEAKITSARARIATQWVGRVPSAKPVDAGDRLYGLMNGELMWTYDMAAVGQEMQNHLWARLKPLSELQISETKKTGKPVNKHVVPRIPGVK